MAVPPGKPDFARQLRPPQFGLRTLLGMVTACGLLFALSRWLHPAAVVLVAFFAVSIFCHVAGNALGTRLRQIGDRPVDEQPRRIETPARHQFAPATVLSRRQRLGWVVLIATSVGVLSGAVGGGLWTFLVAAGPPDAATIAIGVVAFAVLGGLATFMVIGFAQVLLSAIWQALAASSSPAPLDSGPSHGSHPGS